MHVDELNQAKPIIENWHHWFPFAALMARDAIPQNRPMTTRLVEQVFVAVLAGGGSAYTVNDAVQARHDEQIKSLKEQVRDSETRLTAQIMELRARQLK
ncbi:MAG: hypothetical protein ABL877_10900 [Thiobacillus sp.]